MDNTPKIIAGVIPVLKRLVSTDKSNTAVIPRSKAPVNKVPAMPMALHHLVLNIFLSPYLILETNIPNM